MRSVALAFAVLLGCTASPPAPMTAPVSELAGRVAGAPQRCVRIDRHEALRVASPDTLVYGRGSTLWVNHLPGGCQFRHTDILVTDPISTQYCRGDWVRTRDNVTSRPGPACALGDFIPYTRG